MQPNSKISYHKDRYKHIPCRNTLWIKHRITSWIPERRQFGCWCKIHCQNDSVLYRQSETDAQKLIRASIAVTLSGRSYFFYILLIIFQLLYYKYQRLFIQICFSLLFNIKLSQPDSHDTMFVRHFL